MDRFRCSLRLLAAAVAPCLLGALAAGCSSGTPAAVTTSTSATYAPAAYGVQNGKAFDCYYIETPLEAADLVSQGLCPPGSVATQMPPDWEYTYWPYYKSTDYYERYMPASYRTRYTSVYVVQFTSVHSKQIAADASHGTYRSSTGTIVKGTSAAKLKFGSMGSARTVHGGGSGTVSSCSMPMTVVLDRATTVHGGGSGTVSSRSVPSSRPSARASSGAPGGC